LTACYFVRLDEFLSAVDTDGDGAISP